MFCRVGLDAPADDAQRCWRVFLAGPVCQAGSLNCLCDPALQCNGQGVSVGCCASNQNAVDSRHTDRSTALCQRSVCEPEFTTFPTSTSRIAPSASMYGFRRPFFCALRLRLFSKHQLGRIGSRRWARITRAATRHPRPN